MEPDRTFDPPNINQQLIKKNHLYLPQWMEQKRWKMWFIIPYWRTWWWRRRMKHSAWSTHFKLQFLSKSAEEGERIPRQKDKQFSINVPYMLLLFAVLLLLWLKVLIAFFPLALLEPFTRANHNLMKYWKRSLQCASLGRRSRAKRMKKKLSRTSRDAMYLN